MKNPVQILLMIITVILSITVMVTDKKKAHQRIYPAKVVEKILISPTDIPVSRVGFNAVGEPLYTDGNTKTSHAFVIVSTGSCAIIPVDEEYFHKVPENSFVPVKQKTGFITGTIFYQGIHYEFGLPGTNN